MDLPKCNLPAHSMINGGSPQRKKAVSLPKSMIVDAKEQRFEKCTQAMESRVFRQSKDIGSQGEDQKQFYNPAALLLAAKLENQDLLKHLESYNKDFYSICAKENIGKLTKKHSFRSYLNQDRSKESGSDLFHKV